MTGPEVAQVFHAKKCGVGRWTAFCPAHSDRRRPSLSIREGREAVMVYCWSGCNAKEIMGALGLSVKSLYYRSREMDEGLRSRLNAKRKVEILQRRLGLVRVAAEGLMGKASDWWPRPIYDRQEDGSLLLAKRETEERQEFMREIFKEAERQLGGRKPLKWLQQAEIGLLKEIDRLEEKVYASDETTGSARTGNS